MPPVICLSERQTKAITLVIFVLNSFKSNQVTSLIKLCIRFTKLLYLGIIAIKPDFVLCEQQRLRPACASTQSGQHLVIRLLECISSKLSSCEISMCTTVPVGHILPIANFETVRASFPGYKSVM